MKASEFIHHLEKAIRKDGDLEVKLIFQGNRAEGMFTDLVGFISFSGQNNDPDFFLLCDENTFDTFRVGDHEDMN